MLLNKTRIHILISDAAIFFQPTQTRRGNIILIRTVHYLHDDNDGNEAEVNLADELLLGVGTFFGAEGAYIGQKLAFGKWVTFGRGAKAALKVCSRVGDPTLNRAVAVERLLMLIQHKFCLTWS